MRSVIEMMSDHNIYNFVSLAGVQFGMFVDINANNNTELHCFTAFILIQKQRYGTGSTLKKPLSNQTLEEFTDFLYTWEVQDVFRFFLALLFWCLQGTLIRLTRGCLVVWPIGGTLPSLSPSI